MNEPTRTASRRRALAGGLAWAAAAARPRAAAARPPGPASGVAFALGSGSRHGLVHVGMIRAMQVRGWMPDLVVGTSAGAIAGALWTLGLPADRIRAEADALGWLTGVRPALPRRGLLRSGAVA